MNFGKMLGRMTYLAVVPVVPDKWELQCDGPHWNGPHNPAGRAKDIPTPCPAILLRFGLLACLFISSAVDATLVASVLPGSLSVETGRPATFLATLINCGAIPRSDCCVRIDNNLPAGADITFRYFLVDSLNRILGVADAIVDIPAGATQAYLLEITSHAALPPPKSSRPLSAAIAVLRRSSAASDPCSLPSRLSRPLDIIAMASIPATTAACGAVETDLMIG